MPTSRCLPSSNPQPHLAVLVQFLSKSPFKANNLFYGFLETLPDTPNLVRFFQISTEPTMYAVYGQIAYTIADEYLRTRATMKTEGKLPSIWIRSIMFGSIIRDLLLVQRNRIEIYKREKAQYVLQQKASPGHVREVEDLLFGEGETDLGESAVIMAVWPGRDTYGIAFMDTSLHRAGISEVSPTVFESLCVQLNANECILPEGASVRDVQESLERCKIVVNRVKRRFYSERDVEQDLTRLMRKGKSAIINHLNHVTPIRALAALVRYLGLLSDSRNFSSFELSWFDPLQHMKLDASAAVALDLIDVEGSLFSAINRTRTKMGSRLLRTWILRPSLDLSELKRRMDIVETLVREAQIRIELSDSLLRGVPDLSRISKRFQRKTASLKDIVAGYDFALNLNSIRGVLGTYFPKYSETLGNILSVLGKFKNMVETVVEREGRNIRVKPSCDPKLLQISRRHDVIKAEIREIGEDVCNSVESLDPKYVMFEHGRQGWYFRVTKRFERFIRKKRYIVLEARKNGVKFTTKELTTANNNLTEVNEEYELVQSQVVQGIVDVSFTFADIFEVAGKLVSELDVLSGFATLASELPYVRPVLTETNGPIILRNARHPCVELRQHFIPNSVVLDPRHHPFAIITGPNMFGKSTFLKMVGVCVVLAQIGCYVPAEAAEISLRDAILVRVGASDRQAQGVSTFMAEMLEAATVLRSTTSSSLVIIDELGRGTSTADGFGLAWAITEHIATKLHSLGLFATHFHELTALADSVPLIQNLCATYTMTESGAVTPLFRIKPGKADQSLGIRVAELVNFPKKVVDLARKKHAELENETSGSNPRSGKALEDISSFVNAFREIDFAAIPPQQLYEEITLGLQSALSNKYVRELIRD